ncbi:Stk1 family PASTA domain-containing Ser/Thr kinase [Nocardioides sp.]|uniref:Stk1 family PASTA domain-containing Ser/Thr kinase n=1 Tax=Nocardioides sp. TaxID=35761 RepID=UPI0037845AC8
MTPDRRSERHAPAGVAATVNEPTSTLVTDQLAGRVLDGRYRVGARIARGGMASVYEATDLRLDRTVAVKVMHPGLGDDDEFAARFVREARAAARLSHPNVVAVYDQGDDHGTVFLAMELIDGITLRDVIRKEAPIAPARALALIEPVLSALAAAHRAGLVHRDVKPENVLIADDGRIKVADFGLARAVSADTQHTATGGVLIGTVSYLAPELVVDGRADARADVYAAGVVLFEMLTGTKPHEGETPIQVAYKHVHEDVPAPSSLVPGIPAYVDALVARATARDRSHRPADAGVLLHQVHRVSHALAEGVADDPDLTADLTPLLFSSQPQPQPQDAPRDHAERTTFLPTQSPPPPAAGPPVRTGRRPRRRRGLLATVLAVLLVAGLGVGAWWFLDGRYTSTPGVLGLTRAAAAQELQDAGLEATFEDEAYSETVPAGRVVATDPAPGAKVVDGGSVAVTLSLGKERYDVPKLAGLTEDKAKAALAATHLVVGSTEGAWSDTVPKGTVVSTSPKAGVTVRPDTAVSLVVSKGPQPVTLKDWVGKSSDDALAWLDGKGLDGKVTSEEYSDTVDDGDVISMDPPGGTTLHRGDDVNLVVSQGPELVEVPGVRAQGVEAATSTLEALGFKVVTEKAPGYLGLGFVYAQSPGGGDKAPKGSTIVLEII